MKNKRGAEIPHALKKKVIISELVINSEEHTHNNTHSKVVNHIAA